MKELILVRHAKSSWDNPDWTDFNRPLNKRGLADAPFMANLATKWEFKPQMIISSTANRALTTSKIFAEAFGLPSESFIED
jgi:phosphohistidine phosphatase